jgi:cytidylate kinase
MIVTIDGPAGAGKSTIAKLLARRLGIRYLDTGAMYRAVAWKALQRGVSTEDESALAELARTSRIEVDEGRVEMDGKDITGEIRTEAISQAASVISAHPLVRQALVELQRGIGRRGSLVTEGRDQGSVVFPDADRKFYLVASTEERARRRHRDVGGELEAVRSDLERRDARDRNRAASPLVRPTGAIEIDTTALTVEEVMRRILEAVGPVRP